MSKEIPVYLFVGFLESGKTKFIQETFEDPQFDSGDKTLLLICEEGEEEYDPEKFAFGGVYPATLEDKSELTKENLEMLAKKSGCGRVVVEYNGMWMLNDLAAAMPDNWVIYQCIATADGSTFKLYANDNAMRSLLLAFLVLGFCQLKRTVKQRFRTGFAGGAFSQCAQYFIAERAAHRVDQVPQGIQHLHHRRPHPRCCRSSSHSPLYRRFWRTLRTMAATVAGCPGMTHSFRARVSPVYSRLR